MKIVFEAPFKDGNIFGDKRFRVGQVEEVTADQYITALRSGAIVSRLPEPKEQKPKVVKSEKP